MQDQEQQQHELAEWERAEEEYKRLNAPAWEAYEAVVAATERPEDARVWEPAEAYAAYDAYRAAHPEILEAQERYRAALRQAFSRERGY